MSFYIFLPEDAPQQQRGKPYGALYFLAGLTCSEENGPLKSGFAPYAKKANIAMIFPDTSPRGVDAGCPEAGSDDWTVGYGAGHYCNATAEPWKKHFNMYTYVSKELPELVEKYFPVDPARKSITGFSMGGNGAIIVAAKNPGMFKSMTSFAPFVPTQSVKFGQTAMKKYFSGDEAKQYDCVELLNAGGADLKLPPGWIEYASADQFDEALCRDPLKEALGKNGHDIPIRMQEGYNHSFFFINSCIEEHINFHAAQLNAGQTKL